MSKASGGVGAGQKRQSNTEGSEACEADGVQLPPPLATHGSHLSLLPGVKSLHVLAFTSQFAIMSHHIEMMLAQVGVGGDEVG